MKINNVELSREQMKEVAEAYEEEQRTEKKYTIINFKSKEEWDACCDVLAEYHNACNTLSMGKKSCWSEGVEQSLCSFSGFWTSDNQSKYNTDIERIDAKDFLEMKGIKLEPEFQYPLFKKSKNSGAIWKFTGFRARELVWKGESDFDIGYSAITVSHTDERWLDVLYDKELDLWHGQPIEVWDDMDTHERRSRFYNALNKNAFYYNGKACGTKFQNYKAIDPKDYKQWMVKAYKTLEGI